MTTGIIRRVIERLLKIARRDIVYSFVIIFGWFVVVDVTCSNLWDEIWNTVIADLTEQSHINILLVKGRSSASQQSPCRTEVAFHASSGCLQREESISGGGQMGP